MIAHLCITKWCTEANRILQYSQERAWKTWASRGWWSCNKVIIHLYMYMYVGWWWLLWGRGCLQCSVAMPAMARTLPAAWCLANPWPRPDVPSVSRTPRVDVACASSQKDDPAASAWRVWGFINDWWCWKLLRRNSPTWQLCNGRSCSTWTTGGGWDEVRPETSKQSKAKGTTVQEAKQLRLQKHR